MVLAGIFTDGWVAMNSWKLALKRVHVQCFSTYTIATKTIHACEYNYIITACYTLCNIYTCEGMFVTALVHDKRKSMIYTIRMLTTTQP